MHSAGVLNADPVRLRVGQGSLAAQTGHSVLSAVRAPAGFRSSSLAAVCPLALAAAALRVGLAAAAAAASPSLSGQQNTTHTHTHTHAHESLTSDFSRLEMAFVNSIRTYSEKKLIGYSREQLFDVVAAVENYHLFVPACRRSDVIQRSDNQLKAKLEIGIPPLLEAYTSNVKLVRPKLVTASCVEGVLFKHLETRWRFNTPPKPYSPDLVCQLDFYVSFEFKTLLYAKLATPIFDEMVRLNVSAFLKRAHQLYGPQNSQYSLP